MPDESTQKDKWNVLIVEDEEIIRHQVRDYLSGETFASQDLNISEIASLDDAVNLIRERKADLVILDVYRGKAQQGGEQVGVQILERIRQTGFVPVVLYTALPEGLDGQRSKFVRLVGKDTGGLEKLKAEIEDLFLLRIPQVHRAIVNHIDETMCTYMWGFVQEHWTDFEPLINKPEFLRLLVQRLALTFARQGVDQMAQKVYGAPPPAQPGDEDTVHPAEYYVKPPVGQDPVLGDIRRREKDGATEYLVVLWPTCDMVATGTRQPKTDFVLCARAELVANRQEVRDWITADSSNKKRVVEQLVKNTRDRFHFLPGVWDLPHLLLDFQALEHVRLTDVRGYTCVATLASPFAESVSARFQKYVGRIGTPDLVVESILGQIKDGAPRTTDGNAENRE
jgi:CheY-like chemotaxis protein